jgi:MFS family permease
VNPRRDRALLYSATLLRSLATGTVGILLGFYLKRLELDPKMMGLVIGAGLAGNAAAAFVATFAGDRIGRRRLLVLLGALGAAGGLGVAAVSSLPLLLGFAFLGMVNGMGRERGAALVLEQSIAPTLAEPQERTSVFAWYNVSGDVGHGLGAALAMVPALLRASFGFDAVSSVRLVLAACAFVVLATMPLSSALSASVEVATAGEPRPVLSPRSRSILARVSALFAIDSLGGGFLGSAWLTWFFEDRFHVGEAWIGALFVGARLLNAVSHLGAAWLASRIGLVNTMVFTHLPSSVLLLTMLVAPSFPVAAALFLLREGLSQMDVPTRQSYLMAVMQPEERTLAAGVTHLVRLSSWAAAPSVAGLLIERVSAASPFALGASLKIVYDVLLYVAFRRVRPPEES